MDKSKINIYLENTVLKPLVLDRDIDQLIGEAKEFHFKGICVPPFWVQKAAREVRNTDIQLVTVIGFPLGYNMTETKVQETQQAIKNGANEIDMVMNLSAFKTGLPWVKIEIAKLAALCHENDAVLKVIIETAYLSDEEIIQACKICADAGADYVKTSTGFAPAGAKVEHIRLMRENLPSSVGIKASGGIKDFETARLLIEAGADRIGTSSGVAIVKEALQASNHL
jgi:deoxyribose-phosphate aldolase